MNCILDKIWASKTVIDRSGNVYKLNSEISKHEGEFIWKLINEGNIKRTVEIGCKYGISSLYICDALSKKISPHHVIIDPNQSKGSKGIGIFNIEKAGFSFYELIEKPSEIALPNLLEKGEEYDFALIDGWHTFDHTLIDFYYLNRLIKIGGIIAFDDCSMESVNRVIRYVSKYPNYKIIGSISQDLTRKRKVLNILKRVIFSMIKIFPDIYTQEVFDDSVVRADHSILSTSSMVAFKKVGSDDRSWDWHQPF